MYSIICNGWVLVELFIKNAKFWGFQVMNGVFQLVNARESSVKQLQL